MITTKKGVMAILTVMALTLPMAIQAEEGEKSEAWLTSLKTDTPQAGFELAIKLSRMGVKITQPDKDILFREREKYAGDGEALIHASEVVAVHFQTVAAANNYWQ
ncbi:hexameric tyrosine-coordinated heme protein [Marinobacter salicampi]|uniref:hexameric tyrosine-coordinated heme protein n=1 Tax=Marinobacter salicampi TaxID=435907 RepID=UPI001A9406A0|nr:hexameric tyrosine-coordinated heme protein [Marinobacter salicampi]